MKRFFTLLLSVFMVTMVMGQKPEAVIKKTTVAPVIDGEIDDVWATADPNLIDKPFVNETPTVGESGETWWKALWDDQGIYILVNVNDNTWAPAYGAANSYLYDKIEIYFDTNFQLEDGKGPQTDANGGGNGHYQFAPDVVQDSISGGYASSRGGNGSRYSFNVEDPAYFAEFFIPFTKLVDGQGAMVDKTGEIGFDVTVADNDVPAPGGVRNRAVWANTGTAGESWTNMDDAGIITLEGAVSDIWVDAITLNQGGTITSNNGTLQMTANIVPEDATNKTLKWSVENGTGIATIDANGLLTAIKDGTVTVKASALDAGQASATADVVISGQILSQKDVWNNINLIKNWDFNNGLASWGNWVDTGTSSPGQTPPVVVDGAVVMVPVAATDNAPWHYQFNQSPLSAKPNVPYVLHFKSWASADAPAVVDFESGSGITPANGGDQYNRYGASTDANAVGGRSEWNYTITTDPQWFTYHVTFDQIIETTIQKLQFMVSLSNSTIYLDSVLLVEQEYFDQLATLPTASKSLANSIDKVYPNPVGNGNSLFVELSAINSKVAIYNSVGQKLMEKTANGYKVEFDVSSLRQGMYFVKTSDGSIQKFIR